ncbi:MAG TPA: putative Ig domain-containing protein, partial [Ilumatobacteraceae bacterium]
SFWVSLPLVSEPTGDVTAIITTDEAIEECVEDNNFSRASVIEVRASDPFGAFATQTFIANLEDTNSPPTITSQPIVDLKQGFGYEYRVTVADADVGDAHEFQLTAAPKGLFINELSGQLGYDSRELAVGTHDVVVRATDLRGASATQAFRLDVHPNGKPVITSTPGTSVQAGELYSYTVVATDPDGDELEYRLDGAPLTMTVDSATGLVQFTPESRHAGNQPVAVIADDRRGGTSRQAFTLTVTTPPPNQAPRITSTPIEFARPGVEYVYDVDASDGDGDALTYALGAAPAGMVIEAETGLIRWTPPLASSIEVIAVVVTDGRGGSAAQLFALESREAPNRAPVITSSPSPVAYAGVLYRYDVQASDPDGDALSYALVEAPAGTSIDDVTGRVEWTPAAGTTSARIAVLVRDVHGAGTIQAFTVTLAARAPVAVADAYEVRAGETLSVTAPGVLANDVDPDGLALRASLVTSPTRGTLELRPNGSFTYAPRAADAAPFAAQLEWAWSFSAGTAQLPFTPARFGPPQVGSTPTVADLDGDGAPEIIVPVRYRLVILSGQDGHVRFFTEG